VVCLAVLLCIALYFARVTVYGVSCRPGLYAAKFARKFAAVALKVGMSARSSPSTTRCARRAFRTGCRKGRPSACSARAR